MSLAVGMTFDGYTVLRPLGSGGMAEVYLAQHPRLPRHDALKILSEAITADGDFRERFQREADLAAALWHPNIVAVHDRGEFDGQLWIAMDYVDGREGTGTTGALRFADGQWQGKPNLQAPSQCDGTKQPLTDDETRLWSWEPQPGGTLRGIEVGTILSNECGKQGTVYRTPFVATRTGDVAPSVIVADPALFDSRADR